MNTMNLFRHHAWLQRIVAGTLTAALAFGPLQASAQGSKLVTGPDEATMGSPASAAALDPVALERAQKKLRDAVAIADHFVPEATAAGLGDSWRMTMITNLMKGSQANFANVASAKTLMEARMAAVEVAAAGTTSNERSKILSSVTADLLFTPMTPCRLVDTTQTGGGGPFTAGEVRTYFYSTNYGSSGCSPDLVAGAGSTRPAAMAVNINVLALSSSFANAGYLAAYPDGGAPNTAWMTYKFGDVIANAGVMPFNQSTGNYKIFVQFGTHIKIDVFGVFSSPVATALDCTDVYAASNVVIGPSVTTCTTTAALQAVCGPGYTATAVIPRWITGSVGANLTQLQIDSTSGYFQACWFNSSGSTATMQSGLRCCRVPGR